MKDGIAEIGDVKELITTLTRENKKYVIAVANALLFSQRADRQRKPAMVEQHLYPEIRDQLQP